MSNPKDTKMNWWIDFLRDKGYTVTKTIDIEVMKGVKIRDFVYGLADEKLIKADKKGILIRRLTSFLKEKKTKVKK